MFFLNFRIGFSNLGWDGKVKGELNDAVNGDRACILLVWISVLADRVA